MIEDIKSRLDIVDYIGRTESLKRVGGKFKCLCPFHSEKTPSFSIDPERQTWRCFGACATGGDVIDFAARKHNWTTKDAVEKLAAELGLEIKGNRTPALDRLYAVLNAALALYQEQIQVEGNPALLHLRGRGLEAAIDSDFKLGYAASGIAKKMRDSGYTEKDLLDVGILIKTDTGIVEMFRSRLIIPLFDDRGRVVGFAGRTLTDQKPKFINTPKTALFERSHILYGYAQAKAAIRSSGTAVVVEGYFDVIAAHLKQKMNVVAQMGTEMTEHQARLLGASRVIIALDGDSAGVTATKTSLYQSLKQTKNLLVMNLPTGDDPDDVILRGEWDDRVQAAVPALDYLIDLEDVPKTFPEKQAAAKRMLEMVNVENALEAQYAAQKIALAFGLPDTSLFEQVKQQPVYSQQHTNAIDGALELVCIRAYLKHYAYANRSFRAHNLPIINAADFLIYGSLFSIVLAATEQYDLDPADYVQQYYADFTAEESTLSGSELVDLLLILRQQAIDVALPESEDKLSLLTQKANILMATTHH